MSTTVVSPSTEYVPLPEGANEAERVPLALLERLIRPETARRVRWARLVGDGRVDIAMPFGCRLVMPTDEAAIRAGLVPVVNILRRAAGC